jgi:energy-coupling factor transporter ATP-binding protein EcfA2
MPEFIAGANFSGRSAALRTRLTALAPGAAFFVGPYAEAALSGLSSTVADEVAIYAVPEPARAAFAPLDFQDLAARKPPTLSGGEQVLLALHCFSRSDFRVIGVDTALEQLDPENRTSALEFLSRAEGFDAVLIDNRIEHLEGWSCGEMQQQAAGFACDLATVDPAPRSAPTIAIKGLSFRYPAGREIFRDVDLTLEPAIYRLTGANGAGKTTLFRLLAGVLAPSSGTVSLDGAPYAPWRSGNRIFALAAQNPDHQWCGATLAEDLARRRRALARYPEIRFPTDAALASLAARLGIASLDQHLYELPLVARKRASWLWPLAGALPWVMLDEPTVGQDRVTRDALAAAISHVAARGYGVLFITHDDAFAASIVHREVRLEAGAVGPERPALRSA